MTDCDRWRQLVVQSPGAISFQRMDDMFLGYQAKVDEAAGTIVLSAQNKEVGRFTIEKPAEGRLVLDGSLNGRSMRLETSYADPANFRLRQGKFRWFQDMPFNR